MNFIKSLNFEQNGFIQLKNDPPDFVITNETKNTIGVELCELWDANNQKEVQSGHEKIINYNKVEFLNLSQREIHPFSVAFLSYCCNARM